MYRSPVILSTGDRLTTRRTLLKLAGLGTATVAAAHLADLTRVEAAESSRPAVNSEYLATKRRQSSPRILRCRVSGTFWTAGDPSRRLSIARASFL